MARPKKTPAPHIDAADTANQQALAEAGDAAAMLGNHLRTIDVEFALDGQYDLQRIELSFPGMLHMHSAAALWLGRALILVHEHESHEDFQAFLDRHGIEPRTANRYAQAALKVQKHSHLGKLGISKVYELMAEDDDSIAVLGKGGTFLDLKLDEIDRMSVRKLKETIRKDRAERADEKAADEEIIAGKDKRINKLLADRRKAGRSPLRAQADDLLEKLDRSCVEACSALAAMRDLASEVEGIYLDAGEPTPPEIFERVDSNREWAAARLGEISRALGE